MTITVLQTTYVYNILDSQKKKKGLPGWKNKTIVSLFISYHLINIKATTGRA